MENRFDLTSANGLTLYLQNTPFAVKSVEKLAGGSINYTWRIALETPYQGHHSAIVKHAEDHIAQTPTLTFSTDRFVRMLVLF